MGRCTTRQDWTIGVDTAMLRSGCGDPLLKGTRVSSWRGVAFLGSATSAAPPAGSLHAQCSDEVSMCTIYDLGCVELLVDQLSLALFHCRLLVLH